jgi:hypothetical protein
MSLLGEILVCQDRLYFLSRRRYGAPAARRHEAGFPLPSPKNQKLSHSSTEDALFTNMQGVFIHFHGQWQKRETNG